MKTTYIKIIVALGLLSSAAGAQTFKPDYATKLTLAGSGTNTAATITHSAATPASSITYTWPDVPGTAGFVLASTTTGGLSWVNPAATANAWNLTGNASSATNFIGTTDATNPFVISTNSAPRISIDGAGVITVPGFGTDGVVHSTTGVLSSSLIVDGDITVGTIANNKLANNSINFTSTGLTLTSPGIIALGGTANYDIDLAHANSWGGTQTFSTAIINGGSIDGTTVGLTTPSTVKTTGLTLNGTTSTITLNASVGTAGQVLTSAGAGATPTWTSQSALAIPFTNITSGTNLTAAMLVGTGASLDVTGTGTINATTLLTKTWASPDPLGATTPSTVATTGLTLSSTTSPITLNASVGTSGQLLTSAGAGATPTWTSQSALAIPFSSITGATNITAAMLVGTGASLGVTGTGTINATTLLTKTWASPDPLGATAPSTVATTGLTMSSTTSPITLNASVGTAGQVLTSAGAGATPTWVNPGATIILGSADVTAFTGTDVEAMAITGTSSYYRISANAPTNLDGVGSGVAGRVIVLANVGTFAITIRHNSATTVTDGFQLQAGDSIILGADGTATLVYDGTTTRWRVIANF